MKGQYSRSLKIFDLRLRQHPARGLAPTIQGRIRPWLLRLVHLSGSRTTSEPLARLYILDMELCSVVDGQLAKVTPNVYVQVELAPPPSQIQQTLATLRHLPLDQCLPQCRSKIGPVAPQAGRPRSN